MAPHGRFYWNELLTDDVEKAKAFYGATLGWTFAEMPMAGGGAYYVAMLGEEAVAGLMDKTDIVPPSVPPHWFCYVNVDDLEGRLKRLEEEGGRILKPPFEVPGIGWFAIVMDSTGAALGWMTAAEGA